VVPGWIRYEVIFLSFSRIGRLNARYLSGTVDAAPASFFYVDQFKAIEKAFPNFSFKIALSEPKLEDH
jgi:hypothetical protein